MSLENVRKNWKTLAGIALVFVLVALVGPLAFYGLPVLFAWMTGSDSVLLLLAFPVLIVGWYFGVLWLGWKASERSTSKDEASLTTERHDG